MQKIMKKSEGDSKRSLPPHPIKLDTDPLLVLAELILNIRLIKVDLIDGSHAGYSRRSIFDVSLD
jgi:hypothetical protein